LPCSRCVMNLFFGSTIIQRRSSLKPSQSVFNDLASMAPHDYNRSKTN
jgi:hypothetical protein